MVVFYMSVLLFSITVQQSTTNLTMYSLTGSENQELGYKLLGSLVQGLTLYLYDGVSHFLANCWLEIAPSS